MSARLHRGSRPFRRALLRNTAIMVSVLSVGVLLPPLTARGDIYVVNYGTNTIGKYSNSGGVVNASLISGLHQPQGIAVSGSNLFVANYGGTIGEYTTSGGIVNASLVSGLSEPEGLVLSGPDLFVANFGNGTIGEYTTSGVVVNASLISGLNGPVGIVVTPAPEPSTLALLGASVLGLLAYAWRRRRVLNPAELCWTVGCRA